MSMQAFCRSDVEKRCINEFAVARSIDGGYTGSRYVEASSEVAVTNELLDCLSNSEFGVHQARALN